MPERRGLINWSRRASWNYDARSWNRRTSCNRRERGTILICASGCINGSCTPLCRAIDALRRVQQTEGNLLGNG
jgi:hypothetical protein